MLVRNETTTSLTPEAIHAIGLDQLAKARAGMEAVRREVGFAGDLAAFIQHLNTDPRCRLKVRPWGCVPVQMV